MDIGVEAESVPQERVGAGFLTGFVIAQIGAYLSFLPLLQILVPLQAAALDPGHKAQLVSEVAFFGAGVAALSNLAIGWVSDRTRWRWGRRRPWIVIGALATAASYGLIATANSPAALLVSVLVPFAGPHPRPCARRAEGLGLGAGGAGHAGRFGDRFGSGRPGDS